MMMKTSRLQELMSGSFFLLKKGANIFLTDRANSLKLGDFGCAAKIRAHTTVAGELQGLVGTQGSRIQRLESIDIRVETELAIGFVSFFFYGSLHGAGGLHGRRGPRKGGRHLVGGLRRRRNEHRKGKSNIGDIRFVIDNLQ